MLIIRRSKLHYTASGIITPICGRLVHRLREDSFMLHPIREEQHLTDDFILQEGWGVLTVAVK